MLMIKQFKIADTVFQEFGTPSRRHDSGENSACLPGGHDAVQG